MPSEGTGNPQDGSEQAPSSGANPPSANPFPPSGGSGAAPMASFLPVGEVPRGREEGSDHWPPGTHGLTFTATGGGYFGIWIVNTLLTVITIGIYSPWAKVRRLRYFYGNTLVDGSPFDFHGSPVAILKGRLIGLALLLAYTQSMKLSLTLWYAVVIVIAAAFPWMLWRSLRFRLANSSYRGIRFAFTGSLRDAYFTFVPPLLLFVLPVLASAALGRSVRPGAPPDGAMAAIAGVSGLLALIGGFTWPWLYARIKRYQHGNARLGMEPFGFSGTGGDSFRMHIKFSGIGLLGAIAGGLCGALLGAGVAGLYRGESGTVMAGVGVAGAYVGVLSALPFINALQQNFVWGHTSLGGTPILSRARGWPLWRISAVNLALTIITLGLYWPYAVVRSMRYRLSTLGWSGDPAALVAGAGPAPVGAMGEETADLFGFDLAL